MPNIIVTISDAEQKAMDYVTADTQDWLDNAITQRSRIASDQIINKLVAHCNENSVALAVGRDAQITQAFDLGVVQRIADVPAPSDD